MIKIKKAAGLLLSVTLALSAGCGKKGGSSSETETTSAANTTASQQTDTIAASSETVTTTKTTAEQTVATTAATTSAAASSSTTVTTAVTTAVQTEPAECADAANAFYQAYIDHDAEKVYSLFVPAEMEGYCELVRDELSGKDPKKVFRRAAVISAIEASMDNIVEIMDYYSDGDGNEWTFSIPEDGIKEVSSEELLEFNKQLGTAFTKAYTCKYMFYTNQTNGKSFTGNSSAFVQLDGKWYISYSTVMGSDLVNFMDFE
ncbi:MAG: hypothetical protein IKO47_01945 [Ruminococcus sp.]|nr:hypothetical protein [Ruminococcus sp.]